MNFQTLKDYFQEFIECKQHKIMFLNGKCDIFEEFKVIDAINFLEEKNKEIEVLNNRVNELEKAVSRKEELITNLDDENFDLENEIERLNNIINEFDKWLLGEKMMFYKGSDGETLIRFNETTSKWLELKGSDK